MRTEKANADQRIRLGPIALKLLAPFMQNGELVTKEMMEAAIILQEHKLEQREAENDKYKKLQKQLKSLCTLLKKQEQHPSANTDSVVLKELADQLSQLNNYHSKNTKHQEYMLKSMSAIATEVRSLKHVVGVMAGAGTTVEKELFEATLKAIDRMNKGVVMFREREGIKIPDMEKELQDKLAYFQNTGRGVDLEEEHEIDEKEYER